MRAAELLGRTVCDRHGNEVGRVLDLRVTQVDGRAEPGVWDLDGLVVGRRWALARLGYAYGDVGGPLPLALLLRALGSHLRFARWDQIDVPPATAPLTLRPELSELPHPREVE